MYPKSARIIQYDLNTEQFVELTPDFVSARGGEASYDGKKVVFTGIQQNQEHWQIWELDLNSKDVQQMSYLPFNCTDPTYLPDGSIVFSGQEHNNDQHALFVINPQQELKKLTFHPAEDRHAMILQDGRIMVNSSADSDSGQQSKQLALRPDGTKVMLYHTTAPENTLFGQAAEREDNTIFYISTTDEVSSVNSFHHNDPNATERVWNKDADIQYLSVYPLKDSLLVTYTKKGDNQAKLGLLYNGATEELMSYDNHHVLEASMIRSRPLPKILPSRIEETDDNGLLLGIGLPGDGAIMEQSTGKIAVWSDEKKLGEVPLYSDGSYYIEVPSNTPLKIMQMDSNSNAVADASDWFWVKPKERRGCIGCHADQSWVPDNRVPMSVSEKPVDITLNMNDLTGHVN